MEFHFIPLRNQVFLNTISLASQYLHIFKKYKMSWIRFICFIANFYGGGLECFSTVCFLPTNINKCWITFSSKVYLILNTLFRTSNLLWKIGSEAKSGLLFVRAWLGNEAWENPVEKLSLLHVNGIKEDSQKPWCLHLLLEQWRTLELFVLKQGVVRVQYVD